MTLGKGRRHEQLIESSSELSLKHYNKSDSSGEKNKTLILIVVLSDDLRHHPLTVFCSREVESTGHLETLDTACVLYNH